MHTQENSFYMRMLCDNKNFPKPIDFLHLSLYNNKAVFIRAISSVG